MLDLQSFTLVNYTPSGWFENDVFEITKAGYWREYEIKLTNGDFKADADKRLRGQYGGVQDGQFVFMNGDSKHSLLSRGDVRGPNEFWFIAPEGLLEAVPDWAGWIEATPRSNGNQPANRCWLVKKKLAPRLHRQKLAAAIDEHARGVTYWRWRHLFLNGQK